MSRPFRVLSAALLLLFPGTAAFAQAVVQTGDANAPATAKPATDPKVRRSLTIDDYKRWRTIGEEQMSPDGKWVAYVLRSTNVLPADVKPQLHILRLDTNQDTVIHYATQPRFSPDSRWITYQIELPPPGRDSARRTPPRDTIQGDTTAPAATPNRAEPPARRRAEVRELATGETQSWQDVQTAEFSPTGSHLLMRRRPPTTGGSGAGGAGGTPAAAPGGFGGGFGASAAAGMRGRDALLHDLAMGRTLFLGSVGEADFNRKGDLLAYTIESTVKDGNGLFAVDLAGNRIHVLDNAAVTYSRLAWNDDGTAVAALKAKAVPRMRERDNVLVVFPNVRAVFGTSANAAAAKPVLLDTTAAGFPKGFVISDRATLSWSDDNKRVFFGTIPRTPAPDTTRSRSTDSTANVDVWRTNDERVQSVQMIRANAERTFTFRQALEVATGRFIALSDSSLRELEVAPDGRWAVGRDARAYVTDYGRQAADFYRVNTMTGERTLMFREQIAGNHVYGISADGRHYLFWRDEKFHVYNLDAGATRVLGGTAAPSFANDEWEYPSPKPSYGPPGYSSDGRGVIVNHKHDLWLLPYDGSSARNLTRGEGDRNEIRFRVARTVPVDPTAPRAARDQRVVDLSKPVTLSAFGEQTKKSGYYLLSGSNLRQLVYQDAMFSTPERALKADRYLFTRQTFEEYPDLRVSGPTFADARKITDANPQQDEFIWGRRVLFEFQNRDGKRMQGMLALPDDYRDGERRPMIVSFYERQTSGLHRHTAPSYLGGMGGIPIEAVSRGYIAMIPDVHFRTGSSHSDMLEAVEAATTKVVELGYADPAKVAVHGHSYGGEGAAFIATQSKMFAAVGMGAGVTDLASDFSQNWGWSYQVNSGSGMTGYDYYLNGQGRWGVSPWDDPELYRRESALPHAPRVTAPVLIMHGTADPTVSFSEGLNFYNALRFNKKTAYLLAYPNEGHGLRGVANRRDLTIRYMQFFDHYLRGAPAPKWMTDGVPFLVKETIKEPR